MTPAPTTSRQTPSSARRWQILSRAVAGFGLGYGLTWLLTTVMATALQALGIARAQAALVGTPWGFAIYAVIVIWAFSVRRARTAWQMLLLACAVFAALLWLLQKLVA